MFDLWCRVKHYAVWATLLCLPPAAQAVQYSLQTQVSARAEFNDNIFITNRPHESVTGLVLTPQAKLLAQEANWQSFVKARAVVNRYSDQGLDSNDVLLDALSSWQDERSQYSLGLAYNRDSSLNSQSDDFGIVARRVKTRLWRIAPGYRYSFSERASLALSLAHTEVGYDNSQNIGFVDYALDTLSTSFVYALSEQGKFSTTLQLTDYASDSGTFEYQLAVLQFGHEYRYSELWSSNVSLGGSYRNSRNESTQTFDFFGTPITLSQTNESASQGVVYNAGITRKLLTGDLSFVLKRTDTTNSFGGLSVSDEARLEWKQNWSERWRTRFSLRYRDLTSVNSGTRNTDRTSTSAELRVDHALDRHWNINASYRYIQRKFDVVSVGTPSSNRLYFGMTYNFRDISTF